MEGGMRLPRWRSLLLSVCFVCIVVVSLFIFDQQHNHIIRAFYAKTDALVILSATLYNNSANYPPNTVVLLANGHQLLHLKRRHLSIMAHNLSGSYAVQLRMEAVVDDIPFYCAWTPFIATGTLPAGTLRITTHDVHPRLPIELRPPFSEKHESVVCVTPLFLHDDWPTLLLSLATSVHFGAFVVLYVRSMLSAELSLLETLAPGRLRLSPWPSVPVFDSFDPNLHLEFRNQASAMTDCLLLYKDSAEFIFFPDIDDILIPRAGGSLYEEFKSAFQRFPQAAVIAYNMSQTAVHFNGKKESFSASSIFSSSRLLGESRWGKLVVRPSLVRSLWIHFSYGIKPPHRQITFPIADNSIIHLRFWKRKPPSKRERRRLGVYDPFKRGSRMPLLNQSDASIIDKRLKTATGHAHFQLLSASSVYHQIINKCYDQIFYNGISHSTCIGPELCSIPRLRVSCMNARGSFQAAEGDGIQLRILHSHTLVETANGCTL